MNELGLAIGQETSLRELAPGLVMQYPDAVSVYGLWVYSLDLDAGQINYQVTVSRVHSLVTRVDTSIYPPQITERIGTHGILVQQCLRVTEGVYEVVPRQFYIISDVLIKGQIVGKL
jgi:hypothetical protein